MRSLNLGCGPKPWVTKCVGDEVYGIDLFEDLDNNIYRADLVIEPIPFEDNFFNLVFASNFLEHIPRLIYAPTRRYPFVELMNEIWRVMVPGAQFMSATPAYPDPVAFRDPTHVNFITDETFLYFTEVSKYDARMHGFRGAFKILYQEWNEYLLTTWLEKIEL